MTTTDEPEARDQFIAANAADEEHPIAPAADADPGADAGRPGADRRRLKSGCPETENAPPVSRRGDLLSGRPASEEDQAAFWSM